MNPLCIGCSTKIQCALENHGNRLIQNLLHNPDVEIKILTIDTSTVKDLGYILVEMKMRHDLSIDKDWAPFGITVDLKDNIYPDFKSINKYCELFNNRVRKVVKDYLKDWKYEPKLDNKKD